MEVLEAKPASRRARLWARLSDPDKRPRRWWFPPSSRRDEVRRMPEAVRQEYQKSVQQAHEKFSETVRLAMLSLLGFALFCLLITFSTPDSSLVVADPTIKMPFADVQVSFQSFVILAPFLLIVVTLYLHIFYGYWLDLETDLQHLTRSREPSEPSVERLPTLFSLDHPVPRLLTAFIFYWLVPLVLTTITWKAAARVEWGIPLVLLTGLVTITLMFLQIRRCPARQRAWNRPCWGVMVFIVGGLAVLIYGVITHLPGEQTGRRGSFYADMSNLVVVPQWFPRPLNIFRADLKGKWLAAVKLRDAYASLANLQEADLRGADLRGADLRGADLQEADLWGAILRGVDLGQADLQGADLQGADLHGAKNLTAEQIQSAQTDENTKLPPDLKTPGPAKHDDAAPPREGTEQSE
jgi:Pentapeptide repeats (8 copies)